MKKIFLLVCIGIINILNAQENKEQFIIKAGSNTSFYSGKISNWKGTLSYQIGIAIEIPITNKISFYPELDYTRLNSESTKDEFWSGQMVNVEQKLRMSVISIPFIFKYNLNDKFDIQLGPQINYISFAERERPNISITDKPNAYINDFDFGLSIGFGYNINSNFLIEARYFTGITELDKNPNTYNSFTNSDLGKISIATLILGYRF